MRKTVIRTVQHKTGERITLLFWRDPYQPVLLPFLWVTLSRRFKARATIDKDVRSLQAFYEYCEKIGFNLAYQIVREAISAGVICCDQLSMLMSLSFLKIRMVRK